MTVDVTPAPTVVYRVARISAGTGYSRISPADNRSSRAGNRYDVVGGGVLYAADQTGTCFRETLARFRPTPRMRELLKDADPNEPGFMLCGGIPQDWRLQRRVYTLTVEDGLPFVDVESPGTMNHLERELSAELVGLGYTGNLDLSDLRNRDRRLSRAIASWVFTAEDETGQPLYSGIRYHSRVNDSKVCWAIFEGTTVTTKDARSIELTSPDLDQVCHDWELRPF